MFSFPTHIIIGAALSYVFGFSLLWGAIGGLLPDLDYFTPWHRGPFHSIVFASFVSVAALLITRNKKKAVSVFIGFCAHPIVDMLDTEGVMILWPFTRSFLSVNLFSWDNLFVNSGFTLLSLLTIILIKKKREKKPFTDIIAGLFMYKHIKGLITKLKR